MSKVTLRNFIITLVILLLSLGGAVFFFFQILNNSQLLEQQIAAVADQSTQEAALLRLQRIAQTTKTDREELSSYFLLRQSDSIAFLSEIERLAPKVGLSLETKSLDQVSVGGREWIQVNFTVGGSLQDVQNFVQILEIIPYVSKLTSVSMNNTNSNQWEADIVIQVQLLTYDQ